MHEHVAWEFKRIMGKTQSKPISTHNKNQSHTSNMHETLLCCNKNAMHEHISTDQHNPIEPKNFTKISKTPKKWGDWEHLPWDWGLNKAESWVGGVIWVRVRSLGRERKRSVEKKGEKWKLNHASAICRIHNLMDRDFYRESVEH